MGGPGVGPKVLHVLNSTLHPRPSTVNPKLRFRACRTVPVAVAGRRFDGFGTMPSFLLSPRSEEY